MSLALAINAMKGGGNRQHARALMHDFTVSHNFPGTAFVDRLVDALLPLLDESVGQYRVLHTLNDEITHSASCSSLLDARKHALDILKEEPGTVEVVRVLVKTKLNPVLIDV